MSKELVATEVEGEQQSSAWMERTSSGKIKVGCKCYRLDVQDAAEAVSKTFMWQLNLIKKIEKVE